MLLSRLIELLFSMAVPERSMVILERSMTILEGSMTMLERSMTIPERSMAMQARGNLCESAVLKTENCFPLTFRPFGSNLPATRLGGARTQGAG